MTCSKKPLQILYYIAGLFHIIENKKHTNLKSLSLEILKNTIFFIYYDCKFQFYSVFHGAEKLFWLPNISKCWVRNWFRLFSSQFSTVMGLQTQFVDIFSCIWLLISFLCWKNMSFFFISLRTEQQIALKSKFRKNYNGMNFVQLNILK